MSSRVPFSIKTHLRYFLFSCLTLASQASPLILPTSSVDPVEYRQRWRMPDGRLPDRSQSIVIGQSLEISWKPLNASINNLWLVSSNKANEQSLTLLIAENIDISKDGSFTWTVDLPDGILSAIDSYAFSFLPKAIVEDPSALSNDDVPTTTSPSILIVSNSNFSATVKVPLSSSRISSSVTSSNTSSPTPSSTTPPSSAITIAAAKEDKSDTGKSDKQPPDGLVLAALLVSILLVLTIGLLAYIFAKNRQRRIREARLKTQAQGEHLPTSTMARRMSSILWD